MTTLQRYWHLLSAVTVRRRIFTLYLLLILMPSSSLLYVYYLKSSDIAKQEFIQSMQQTLKQVEINISYKLDSVANVSDMLISNPNLFSYLSMEADGFASFRQVQAMNELKTIINSAQNNREVYYVRLFIRPTLQYSREGIQFFPLDDMKKRSWYEAVLARNGAIYWSAPYVEHFAENQEDVPVISSTRMLRNPKNYDDPLGVLMIDIKEQEAFKMFYSVIFAAGQTVGIADRSGQVISRADRNPVLTAEQKAAIAGQDEGYFTASGQDPGYLTVFHTIPATGWKMIVQVPLTDISAKSTSLNRVSGIIAILFTFVLFVITLSFVFAFIAESMARRIKKLIDTMRKEGIEDTETRFAQGQGNMLMLEKSISHMIGTVRMLTEQSLQAQIHEKEALLKALQAQINPHFLYNTLEAVNWMAVRRGATDISLMMDALSKYFRLTLNQGQDLVRAEDEIKLAETYLYIQSVRFEDEFTAEMDIAPEVLDYIVPKLTLQPVIENALLHGIHKNRGTHGLLTITGRQDHGFLLFTVTDNGTGIAPDKMTKLLKPPAPGEQTGGYGLYNMHERVRLFSGSGGYVHITSEPGQGTTVTIRIAAVQPNPVK
ncbi:cache domain-containing sensor histidine kinase [Paenibacillus thalictri]|uniref:histidine kinase n=1 Tax=Paenibacillus thalictri TaxID=2527873 RepID=A0A4Q9DFG8_9BACL|nr:sensor histidine kinase [Paenibacillus thalictri]TBL70725.1 sensor histidine kinase [Paenibacillus thalictri]